MRVTHFACVDVSSSLKFTPSESHLVRVQHVQEIVFVALAPPISSPSSLFLFLASLAPIKVPALSPSLREVTTYTSQLDMAFVQDTWSASCN